MVNHRDRTRTDRHPVSFVSAFDLSDAFQLAPVTHSQPTLLEGSASPVPLPVVEPTTPAELHSLFTYRPPCPPQNDQPTDYLDDVLILKVPTTRQLYYLALWEVLRYLGTWGVISN
ncbi:hypothetical protein I316_04650 [Kwoniella heveanensis BCC8398]|uniref:Uncharacterized protein n=1 Tax=Kwoniella heveanensis BCC8398 TaxID=1296120 RepID=A0A1B9GRG3_9TREE|nr:hypothetical protein I316_04650 [Kwoniella heveanensis BCC8398]